MMKVNMRLNFNKNLILLFALSACVALCCQMTHPQDTVKVPLKDIEGAILDKNYQIEQILSGKSQNNVYYLQGQLDILSRFKEIGLAQKAQRDTAKADTLKQSKKVKK